MALDINKLRNLAHGSADNNPVPDPNIGCFFWIFAIAIGVGIYFYNNHREKSEELYIPYLGEDDNSYTKKTYASTLSTTYSSKKNITTSIPEVKSECIGFYKSQAFVTLRDMAVRNKPLTYSPNDIEAIVPKGKYVCPIDSSYFTVEGDSSKWLYAKFLYSDNSSWGKGWIKGTPKYVHKIKCLYVRAKTLNYRDKPLTGNKLKSIERRGHFNRGDQVCSLDEVIYNGAPWYKVELNKKVGWVNSSYLLRDKVDLASDLEDTKENMNEELRARLAEYIRKH